MRVIEGIPESSLLQQYAGKYAHKLIPENCYTYSGTAGANITICVLRWDLDPKTRISLHYTKTLQSIIISLKKEGALQEDWKSILQHAVPLHDPDGVKKMGKTIRLYLQYYNKHYATPDSEVLNL